MNEQELLIRIDEQLKELKRDFENHLVDHKKYMVMAWTTCIGLMITLGTLILKLL